MGQRGVQRVHDPAGEAWREGPEGPGGSPVISREIREQAQALGRTLAAHPVTERLRRARATVNEHTAALVMLRDLRRRERALLEKELSGQRPEPDEVEQWRRVAEIVSFNPYVRELLEAEAAMARLLAEVNAAVQGELGLPPVEDGEETEAQESSDASRSARQAGLPQQADSTASKTSPVPHPPGPEGASPRLNVARSRLWVPGQP